MASRKLPRGQSLPELLTAMVLVALLVGLAVPGARYLEGAVAARGARDALAAMAGRARALAVGRGGAALVVDPATSRAWIEAEGLNADVLDLGADFGVEVAVDGRVDGPLRLRFDALGIGRLTSRTLRVRRGGAEARLTLSSYGRVRTW